MTTNITASMVKELRDKTGAGMMDCKAALTETAGDLEGAVDWLRKKGLSKAAKKSGRIAAEGLVGVALNAGKGVLVEVNSETDFVARNDLFQGLVKMIANVALDVGADVDKILAARIGDRTVADDIAETVAKIGENMTLRRAAELSVGKGLVASYMHNSPSEGLGRIGVIVALEIDRQDRRTQGGRPAAGDARRRRRIRKPSIRQVSIRRSSPGRRECLRRTKAQGKPANVVDKIVESGLKTFYKEVCLLDQPFIFDDKKTVAQALKESEGKVGGPIKVAGFVRFALGEGIERPTSDFGGEVAALAGV